MGLSHDLKHFFVHVVLGRRRGGGTVRYVTEGLRCRTVGLRAGWAHPELEVEVSDARLVEELRRFLAWVIDSMNRRQARIKAGETMLYGFWQVRWMPSSRKGHLEAWDVIPDKAAEYQPGADLALGYFRQQLEVAVQVDATLHPPQADLLFAYDDGVFAGLPVGLVRRPPRNEDHSGWIIFSERWSGDAKDLKNEHLYHLPVRRPELVRYLGLEAGWCVDLRHGERIWFEQPVP